MELIFIASLDSIHTRRWINYFADLNDKKISIISNTNSPENIERNVNCLIINSFKKFRVFLNAIKKLGSKREAIVHVHYLGFLSLFVIFCNKNKKVILTPWGCDIYRNRKNFLKKIWLRYLFKRADFIICDSSKLLKAFSEIGEDDKSSRIIAFGTDIKKFSNFNEPFKNSKEQKTITIGTNRLMEKVYDPFTFLYAANFLLKKNKNYRFLIAGRGILLPLLEEYIKEESLDEYVKIIGMQNGQKNIEFFNSLDIYVSCSLSDGGLAASIAEAMSCERLVIVSDNSENSKYINHGKSGYLFKNKDFHGLACLIEEASRNFTKSREIAAEARKTIEIKCNYYTEMDNVNKIYYDLMSQKSN